MLKHRIIPILLYDGFYCVHTVTHKRPVRRIGPISQYVFNMANRDIDELILIDIEATRQGRMPNFNQIKEFTKELYCPVSYGGGINSIDNASKLIQECGVDKILLKSRYDLTNDMATKFGSQAVVYVLDTWGEVFDGLIACAWAKSAQENGAGEIMLTDVQQQGTMSGFNYSLIDKVSSKTTIPVVANGGCGEPKDMVKAIKAGASAVASSSMFALRGVTPQDCARALRAAGLAARVAQEGPE